MRKIIDNLYIGNSLDGCANGEQFDIVVSLADTHQYTTHSHEITDDVEHDYEEFAAAVDVVRSAIPTNKMILVHCRAGISRSVAVSIAALTSADVMSFDEAFDACQSGYSYPNPDLLDSARSYCELK